MSADEPRLKVMDVEGNRSRGRNAAIAAAAHEVIACIDGGCIAEPTWLEELTTPFRDPDVEWVGGFYRPGGSTTRQVCIGLTMVFVLEEALRGGFFPSARSMAFRRGAWEAVGGFPEDLEVSEDTAFDESLTAAGFEMVFRPDAMVRWLPPETLRGLWGVLWHWSRSDGVAGIRTHAYRSMARVVAVAGGLAVIGAVVEPWLGVLGALPFLALMIRQTRYKYRWADGWSKWLWLPVAWGVGFVARLGGFLAGRRARRSSRPTASSTVDR